MPGGGYPGSFYPGQDAPEENRSGLAKSTFGASGGIEKLAHRTGLGGSEAHAEGTGQIELSRSGTAISAFRVRHEDISHVVREEDGESKFLLENDTQAVLREDATAAEEGNARSNLSSSGFLNFEVVKAGLAKSDDFKGSGTQEFLTKTGSAISNFVASGVRSGEVPYVPSLSGGVAFAYMKRIGERSIKAAGNTLAVTIQGAPVGSMVVTYIAWDNNNASTPTGPDDTQITVADSASNTWVRVAGAQNTSQANRSHVQIYASRITNQIAVGGTVTATHTVSSSWVAKAMAVELFAIEGVAPTVAGRVHVHTVAGDPASLTLSGLADPAIPYILLHGIAAEGPVTDAYTWDADYTQIAPVGTTGSTDDTNMTITGGFRIVDTTSDTVDVTSTTADRDYSQVLAALQTSATRVKSGAAALDGSGVGEVDCEYGEEGVGILDGSASGVSYDLRFGTAQSEFSASGFFSLAKAFFGSADTEFRAGGVANFEKVKQGAATLEASGSGVQNYELPTSGVGILVRSGSGLDRTTSIERGTAVSPRSAESPNAKVANKTGVARAVMYARGRLNNIVLGHASADLSGAGSRGIDASNKEIAKSIFVASGPDESTRGRGGPTLSIRFALGLSASVFARSGTAISGYTASGYVFSSAAAVSTFTAAGGVQYAVERSGTVYLDASAHGWTQPVGTALAVFTGAGWQKDLYANDYYVNREIIDPPTGDLELDSGYRNYTLVGATERATWEDGENGWYIDRSLWWEYTVPYQCIVVLSIETTLIVPEPLWDPAPSLPPPATYGTYLSGGYVQRGAPVPDLWFPDEGAQAPYANAALHFGQDEGRGLDANSSNYDYWGYFLQSSLAFQADPLTPAAISAGKRWYFPYVYYGFNTSYVVTVERLLPPVNDAILNATVLEGASGAIDFDLKGSTGDPTWNWELLDSVIYLPDDYRMSGDIFYRFQPEEDQWCRVRMTFSQFHYDLENIQLIVFRGVDPQSWEPLPVGLYDPDFPYVTLGPDYQYMLPGFVEFLANAGEAYFVAILLMRSCETYIDENDNKRYMNWGSFTVRENMYGQVEWETFATGLVTNDNFADRLVLGSGGSGSTSQADTRGSTFEVGEPSTSMLGWNATTKTIWYEYTPPTSGWYTFTFGSSEFGESYFWAFRGSTLTTLDLAEYTDGWQGYSVLYLRGGDTYALRLVSTEGYTEDYGGFSWQLDASVVESNDDFANRIAISAASGSDSFVFTGATTEVFEPDSYFKEEFARPSLWWGFTAPATGSYLFQIAGYGEQWFGYSSSVYLAVYTGSSLSSLVPVTKAGEPAALAFDAQAGTEYKIQISSAYLPQSTFSLEWEQFERHTNSTFATAHDLVPGTEISWSNYGMPPDIEVGAPDFLAELPYYYTDDRRFARPLWFRITPEHTGQYTFSFTQNSAWNGIVFLYEGDSLETLEPINGWGNWDWLYGQSPTYVQNISDSMYLGTTYYLIVLCYDHVYASDGDDLRYQSNQAVQGSFSLRTSYSVLNDTWGDRWELNRKKGREWPYWGWASIAANAMVGTTYQATGPDAGSLVPSVEPAILGFGPERSVWYIFSPYFTGTYEFWVEGYGDTPVLDPLLAVYQVTGTVWNSFSNFQLVAASDNFNGLYPYLTASLGVGVYYAIQVDSRDEGDFTLLFRHLPVQSPPANDEFANAVELTPGVQLNGTTVGARSDPYEYVPETGTDSWYLGGSVWYVFTAEATTMGLLSFYSQTTYPGRSSITIDEWVNGDLVEVMSRGDIYGSTTTNIFFPVEAGKTYYIRVMGIADGGSGNTGQAPFTIEMLAQSQTPPGNDDKDDAGSASGGSNAGTTDGSTVQPGEPDPEGGTLDSTAGTVWHKYVAPAPGFIAAYTTRDDAIRDQWYRIGVWAGLDNSEFGDLVKVTTYQDQRRSYDVMKCFYEVRKDETYWIQVIRDKDQSWGGYTLHIDEYLETKSWSLESNGFTSTTGSPSISGGVMTCTGSQGTITDPLDVLPQYGTVDLGADTPVWYREFRLHFDVRVVGGQVLRREMWSGGDDWSFNNAASDDHQGLTMNRIGLFRLRDADGNQIMVGSLAPHKDGQNRISIWDSSGYTWDASLSLGCGGPQHDSGWTSIEIVITWENTQNYDGSGANSYGYPNPRWSARIYVNGVPSPSKYVSYQQAGTNVGYSKGVRYFDLGMYRHPSMILANDRRYVEDPEAWTIQFRRMRATNIVPVEPYDIVFAGDKGIFNFDGFKSGVMWDIPDWNTEDYYDKNYSLNSGVYNPVDDTLNLVTLEDRTYIHSEHHSDAPAGSTVKLTYGNQSGRRRWYGFLFSYSGLPAKDPDSPDQAVAISGYEDDTISYNVPTMGRLSLLTNGRLQIRPHGQKIFCVATLSKDVPYWIEVHVDAEVVWDVRCTVYINGIDYGSFSNLFTGAEVASDYTTWESSNIYAPYPAKEYPMTPDTPRLLFGPRREFDLYGWETSAIDHDFLFTNLVVGRGAPGAAVGPLKTVALNAIDAVAGHGLPDEPTDYMDIEAYSGIWTNQPDTRLYGWSYEESVPGPFQPVDDGHGHAPLPVTGPRFWEPYFRLRDTTPLLVSGSGPYNYTMARQSVPVSAAVTGIAIHAPSGTAQLLKNGSPVGDPIVSVDGYYGGPEEMWGTTWTPQEVNDLQFGVQLSVAAATTDVRIQVYFADFGEPGGIERGSILGPAGLYNLYGDTVTAEYTATGPGGDVGYEWPTGGWEPGFIGGNNGVALGSGAKHQWMALRPLWLWQARGDKVPYITFSGVSADQVTLTNIRIVRNALVYPRYAWSDNNGASWTWIHAGEDESSNHIGTDVGISSSGKAIFLDTAGTLDVYMHQDGSWDSGLIQTRPTSSYAYRFMWYYLGFGGENTAETQIFATNLWTRSRPYDAIPSTTDASESRFHAAISDASGNVSRVKYFNGFYGTEANPNLLRKTVPRAADGTIWTQSKFNDITLRIGMHTALTSGTGFVVNWKRFGAALYAATWELLVPDPDPGRSPSPCTGPKYLAKIQRKQ